MRTSVGRRERVKQKNMMQAKNTRTTRTTRFKRSHYYMGRQAAEQVFRPTADGRLLVLLAGGRSAVRAASRRRTAVRCGLKQDGRVAEARTANKAQKERKRDAQQQKRDTHDRKRDAQDRKRCTGAIYKSHTRTTHRQSRRATCTAAALSERGSATPVQPRRTNRSRSRTTLWPAPKKEKKGVHCAAS